MLAHHLAHRYSAFQRPLVALRALRQFVKTRAEWVARARVSATSGGPKGIETRAMAPDRPLQHCSVSATSGGPKGIETLSAPPVGDADNTFVSATSGGPKGIETAATGEVKFTLDKVSATSGGPKGIETPR